MLNLTVKIKSLFQRVKVMSVNDEKPRVLINNGITLEFGESKVISLTYFPFFCCSTY